MRDGPVTQIPWMKNIKILKDKDPGFWDRARKIYYVKDENGKQIVGGYIRDSEELPFTFLGVPKAGHYVPNTYKRPTIQFLEDYIKHQKL